MRRRLSENVNKLIVLLLAMIWLGLLVLQLYLSHASLEQPYVLQVQPHFGGVAATGSTGFGLWMTGNAWYEGEATNTDLAVNLLTTGGGLVAPGMKDAQVAFSLVQLMWDMIPKTED